VTDTRPLNVRVAEALGWTDFKRMPTHNVGTPQFHGGFSPPVQEKVWCGVRPIDHDPKECVNLYGDEPCDHVPSHPDYEPWHEPVPPYGEETPEGWACTGPLMVRFGLSAIKDGDVYIVGRYGGGWYPSCDAVDGQMYLPAEGPKVLAAVAEWIMANPEETPKS